MATITKIKNSELFKSFIFTLIGTVIYSFALTAFIIPSHLVTGGFTGLAMILYYTTGIPVGITNLLVNIILIFVAFKIMGWKFAKLSIFGVAIVSVVLIVMQKCITQAIVEDQPFMNALIGGGLSGVGIGIIFNAGANTGGSDIIALIVNKYRNISPGKFNIYFNLLVIGSFYFIYHDIEKVVYAFVVLGVSSYTLDLILNGNRQSYQFLVISPKYQEIADEVTSNLGRGVTAINAKGWYNKSDTEILLIICHRRDKAKILHTIKKIDQSSFLSVSKVEGAYGRNFETIKL